MPIDTQKGTMETIADEWDNIGGAITSILISDRSRVAVFSSVLAASDKPNWKAVCEPLVRMRDNAQRLVDTLNKLVGAIETEMESEPA